MRFGQKSGNVKQLRRNDRMAEHGTPKFHPTDGTAKYGRTKKAGVATRWANKLRYIYPKHFFLRATIWLPLVSMCMESILFRENRSNHEKNSAVSFCRILVVELWKPIAGAGILATPTKMGSVATNRLHHQATPALRRMQHWRPIDGQIRFVTVTVRNSRITDVKTANGTSLPAEKWGWYETFDGMFEIIRNTSLDKRANMHVTYDDRFGYPTVLDVRGRPEVMDDELFRETKELAY